MEVTIYLNLSPLFRFDVDSIDLSGRSRHLVLQVCNLIIDILGII